MSESTPSDPDDPGRDVGEAAETDGGVVREAPGGLVDGETETATGEPSSARVCWLDDDDAADVIGPCGWLAGSLAVVYTDEAVRATAAAEDTVIREVKGEIDSRFDG
mgnify:CR=1 FL=1